MTNIEKPNNTFSTNDLFELQSYPAITVANSLIELSIENNNILTQISILKLLYFINAYYLVMYNQPLIEEKFQAWKFGPVLPDLYRKYLAKFGYIHIAELLGDKNTIPETDTRAIEAIRDVYDRLRGYEAFELVEKTHKINGAWYNTYHTSPYQEISNSEIIREFKIQSV